MKDKSPKEPKANEVQILPALPDPEPRPEPRPEPDPDLLALDPDNLPPPLAFTPVPRRGRPNAGINALRQRHFIAYLAGNGSVEMSATAVGISASAFYQVRKAEGAESFSAAWDVAIDMGSRRVLDTFMDHAIHGVPEKLFKDGELILERRKFNTRGMMWIIQQRFPELFGGNLNVTGRPASSLPHGLQKLKEEWHKEWQKEHLTAASEEEAAEAVLEKLKVLHNRTWHRKFLPWMDDAEKRAAADLLYGAQDWDLIRKRARKDELNGALEPEEEVRLLGMARRGRPQQLPPP